MQLTSIKAAQLSEVHEAPWQEHNGDDFYDPAGGPAGRAECSNCARA